MVRTENILIINSMVETEDDRLLNVKSDSAAAELPCVM